MIGLELGIAFSRLGLDVTGVNRSKGIGGLTDPDLQNYAFEKLKDEFPTFEGEVDFEGPTDQKQITAVINNEKHSFDKVLVSIGRRSNIDKVGIEKLGVKLNDKGIPGFNSNTMALDDCPHIYLAGDVNGDRSILHEAADEGRIAGYNSVNETECFERRTPLGITFSDPNIARIGLSYKKLKNDDVKFVTGEVSFEGQGRSIVKLKEQGLLHVYIEREGGKILGAELQALDGEHLAHLIAWAISMELIVFEAIKMPFYHPVVEEGLRTALRSAAKKLNSDYKELFMCDDSPIR